VFKDKNWLTKLAIGAAILLVSLPLTPILIGFAGVAVVLGYCLETLRNVRGGSVQPLPEWRDRWSQWAVSGLKYLFVLLIWSLPAIVLNAFSGLGDRLIWASDGAGEFVGSSILVATACLGAAWWLFFFLILPAITLRLAETDDVRAGLAFEDLYFLTRNHLGEVIVAVVAGAVAYLAVVTVGTVLGVLMCFVGLAITLPAGLFLATLMATHLLAQVAYGSETTAPPRAQKAANRAAKKSPANSTMVVMPDGTVVSTDEPKA
jgi:hypothetical protein